MPTKYILILSVQFLPATLNKITNSNFLFPRVFFLFIIIIIIVKEAKMIIYTKSNRSFLWKTLMEQGAAYVEVVSNFHREPASKRETERGKKGELLWERFNGFDTNYIPLCALSTRNIVGDFVHWDNET